MMQFGNSEYRFLLSGRIASFIFPTHGLGLLSFGGQSSGSENL
jgi:hypothetical protein